jgi:hypothetical protein
MEVHFTPEQEAQSSQIASHAGTDTERLVKDAALRLLEQDARFRAAVRNSSKRKRWMRASSGCLTPDAYQADGDREASQTPIIASQRARPIARLAQIPRRAKNATRMGHPRSNLKKFRGLS